jgi:hypothetical protein
MKVYWHIGPHKTGTTALQRALREHAVSGKSSYFYPTTSLVDTVAHAQLAWRFLGLAGCVREPEILLRRVAAAKKAGFEKIVFSSEEFSRAMFVNDGLEFCAQFCEQVECELVLTLSPLPQRIIPELQEAVRHGESFEEVNEKDLLRLCATRPGLRPDFLSAAILGTRAASVSVIHVDKNQPDKLYRGMAEVVGEPIPIPKSMLINQSSPYLKTEWLSAFNKRLLNVPWETARAVVDAAFAAATREFGSIEQSKPPDLPRFFLEYIAGVWESQLKFLEVMQDAGRVRCL